MKTKLLSFFVLSLMMTVAISSCKRNAAPILAKIARNIERNEILQEPSQESRERQMSATNFSVAVNGNTISTSVHNWAAISVQGNSTYTIVVKQCYPKVDQSWVCNSGTEYIEDCNTGDRYYLTSSDIGVGRENRTILQNSNPFSFNEYYPALPNSVTRINISSGSSYYATNIIIR